MITSVQSTKDEEYANYLIRNQKSFRSAIFQWPYRTHLQSLRLGRTLDIGCGAGRNLKALNSESVGIDHNPLLVESCNEVGLTAYTTEVFLQNASRYNRKFSSILISHVAEHMSPDDFTNLLRTYRPFLSPGGRVVVICPQEKGYESDSTHVHYMDYDSIELCLKKADYSVASRYSFPLPKWFGSMFTFNEFVVIGRN